MKRVASLAVVLLFGAVVLSGCADITAPARLGSSGYLPLMNTTTEHKFDKDSFKVLGPVTAKTEGITILFGLITTGDNGYAALFEEARKKYKDADTVIDLREDRRFVQILGWLYLKEERIITGTAIKYVR
jgi:hypothetical protein